MPHASSSPPRLGFGLSLGVTGHRAEALAEAPAGLVEARLREVIAMLGEAARALAAKEAEWFDEGPPRLTLVSPLADGADQLAAEIALKNGFGLQAILPFTADEYRGDFPDAATIAKFDALLKQATCRFELPGNRAKSLDAYVMAGRATVAHSDLLIAVWDGQASRGRGGTAEIVALATEAGTPIVHIPIDPAAPITLRWSAFDPAVVTRHGDEAVIRILDAELVERTLEALLAPPPDPDERQFIREFRAERLGGLRPRIEYPLLLALTGVGKFGKKDWQQSKIAASIRNEWEAFRTRCAEAYGVTAPLDLLEQSYSRADQLATRFAQTYRSGHVFNFLLAALAVMVGLSAFMLPWAKLELAALELIVTLAIIVNSLVGSNREWHRRWLDYRQLAERLRPLRSLKLLGVAAPDPPGSVTNPVARRWIDWYAAAVWRAMGCPSGTVDAERAQLISRAIADHELVPQIAYHRASSHQVERLDRRLERISLFLFIGTLAVSIAVLLGLATGGIWVTRFSNWTTLVSAGFPALGTAIFGIRFQGDFGGTAVRSLATADLLAGIDRELRADDLTLPRAANLIEQASRAMFVDLDEWRLINQQHDLSVA